MATRGEWQLYRTAQLHYVAFLRIYIEISPCIIHSTTKPKNCMPRVELYIDVIYFLIPVLESLTRPCLRWELDRWSVKYPRREQFV